MDFLTEDVVVLINIYSAIYLDQSLKYSTIFHGVLGFEAI